MKTTKSFCILLLIIFSACNRDIKLENIELEQKALLLNVNDNEKLSVKIHPSNYNLSKINWESSNKSVATIDNLGNLTAMKPGEAMIIANAGQEISDTCYVTVVNIRNYNTANGLLHNQVPKLAVDSTGNLWCATYFGTSKYDGTNWTSYTQSDGLIDNRINCVAVDGQNNIWFGTEAGISKFDGENWTSYTTQDGLVNNTVIAMAFDNQGNNWFGTWQGASKQNSEKWTTYTNNDDLLGYEDMVIGIAIDRQNNDVWVISHVAVSIFNGTKWTGFYHELTPLTIYGITIDRHNDKWLSTINGFYKLEDSSWVHQMDNSDYPIDYAHDIIFDKNDNNWFTTRDGIFRCVRGRVSTFKGDNYTLINSTEIRDIVKDREENIWIGKTLEGVFKLETK